MLAPSGGVAFDVRETFAEAIADGADLTLVDMPIGLADDRDRDVDLAAKRALGRRHMCVFPAPPRGVIGLDDYARASAESQRLTGRKLSKQAWNIVPKIREVDAAVRANPTCSVRECHPEVCLWGILGSPEPEPKRTPAGAVARLAALGRFLPGVGDAVERFVAGAPARDVRRDDVIDAAICAVAAAGVWDGSLRTLPTDPPRDRHGLPMEMVYRVPG